MSSTSARPAPAPRVLLLHREPVQDVVSSRPYLIVRVFSLSGDASYFPTELMAYIDTGARISVVPDTVLKHFGGLDNVIRGPGIHLVPFDGSMKDKDRKPGGGAPIFSVHLELKGLDPSTGKRLPVIHTRDL